MSSQDDKLNEFRHPDPDEKEKSFTTSVTILQRHKDFLEREALNLSKLVRALIERLIKGESP